MRSRFLLLLLLTAPALAVEPLTSAALLEQCSSPVNTRAQTCQAWIHGFIGGAFASRIDKYDADSSETYIERAQRTRIRGSRKIYGLNYEAGYCLPLETTLDELADQLKAHAAELSQVPEHANQLMLGLLRRKYSCN